MIGALLWIPGPQGLTMIGAELNYDSKPVRICAHIKTPCAYAHSLVRAKRAIFFERKKARDLWKHRGQRLGRLEVERLGRFFAHDGLLAVEYFFHHSTIVFIVVIEIQRRKREVLLNCFGQKCIIP